ncbi:hypothetical protein DXX93_07645 [Thalassotalea euphylliae]|uniref:Uncharacterized protein n=1 Tax=Thalassotalea euphylliae TaxID=1655234 RepID=A0A3E0TQ53_9GAMM|nr:hypothetical protein [Thalassotalea euphylliae]REL26467.1 hypothetical protein DXX93_07645 [Thalassotalea euphylliae]
MKTTLLALITGALAFTANAESVNSTMTAENAVAINPIQLQVVAQDYLRQSLNNQAPLTIKLDNVLVTQKTDTHGQQTAKAKAKAETVALNQLIESE